MAPSVTYLGHQINKQGLHPVADKVKAIKEAPRPRNKSELKSLIPGATILLLKVLTKHVNYLGATLPTIETWRHLEMGSQRNRQLWISQESAVVVASVGALRPQFGAGRGVSCLSTWCGGCAFTSIARRNWKTNWICLTHFGCVWRGKVPYVYVLWTTFHTHNGPQTVGILVWW